MMICKAIELAVFKFTSDILEVHKSPRIFTYLILAAVHSYYINNCTLKYRKLFHHYSLRQHAHKLNLEFPHSVKMRTNLISKVVAM